VESCGDGKRFELDCDDGNTKNGDGCSDSCEVEKGWTCSGGSSVRASTCVQFIPNKSTVSLTGTVHMFGKIVQGIRMSYIPKALTDNDCPECHKILWIRIIKSDIIPRVRLNFLPKSQYQLMA
jgi:cysteine-rich repeat protein